MNIKKHDSNLIVKLTFNLKPKSVSGDIYLKKLDKVKSYMEGELSNFENLCTDDHASHFEPNEQGISFKDRYIAFLNSPMKKGDGVDVQVLKEFVSDLDNRADIDMNGQSEWETEEDEEYLYYIGGKYFLQLAKNLKLLIYDTEKRRNK
jgi:hypothetical protein